MKRKLITMALMLALAGAGGTAAQDLFEEAGHSLGVSRWLIIRLMPIIQIALEGDDVVLVQSILHPAKGFAMRIDGDSTAADCEVTEMKDTSYTVATEVKENWATASTSTSTTYWAKCQFAEGTTAKAVQAGDIVVQVAMTNGTTKPHDLSTKQLRKFQRLTQ